MTSHRPTLHLVCGKIAAGKSTLTAALADTDQTVLMSEDVWLKTLFADEMNTLKDYVRFSARLRQVLQDHVINILNAGPSVVLDFPANTVETRVWMKEIARNADADHVLHWLDVPDAICIARMHTRNARGNHPFSVTEAQFAQVSAHFEAPRQDEGFNVQIHRDHN
ncbi:ATP-binding protein [Loktanella sp. F6476L]|uniref:AAA family ATPase n=1 Tax=Loktanella sp. F6476L TaxID=2926405 RepID=UPI001FF3E9A3|nr:ATP-binding protein [Loktanella sp. F6476L]MCK0120006.1 ATP-binding protein [Loktanella sp. F6476L]